MNTVLITGSSTGLGLETALYLAERGLRVYASLRDLSQQADILDAAKERQGSLRVLQLDVTDAASIEGAIGTIVAESGGIFGLVTKACIRLRGCFEGLSEAEMRQRCCAKGFAT